MTAPICMCDPLTQSQLVTEQTIPNIPRINTLRSIYNEI